MKERILWIDWAKFIGIAMVVYAHIPNAKLATTCFLFHMPFFFMISGYLFSPRSYKDELNIIVKRLFLPYLIYNLVLLIITPPAGVINGAFNIVIGNQEQLPPNYRAMWFLVSLMIMRFVSSLAPSKMIWIAVFSLVLILGLRELGYVRKNFDALQLNTTMMSYHYFVFGYYFRKYPSLNILTQLSVKLNFIVIIVVSIASVLLGLYYVGVVNLFRCSTGNVFFIFLLVSYILSYLLIRLVQVSFTSENKIVTMISEGTLFVVCTHQSALLLCNFFSVDPYLLPILITLIILVLSYYGIKFCSEYMPLLLGKSLIKQK